MDVKILSHWAQTFLRVFESDQLTSLLHIRSFYYCGKFYSGGPKGGRIILISCGNVGDEKKYCRFKVCRIEHHILDTNAGKQLS
jgi:hypothetical protein